MPANPERNHTSHVTHHAPRRPPDRIRSSQASCCRHLSAIRAVLVDGRNVSSRRQLGRPFPRRNSGPRRARRPPGYPPICLCPDWPARLRTWIRPAQTNGCRQSPRPGPQVVGRVSPAHRADMGEAIMIASTCKARPPPRPSLPVPARKRRSEMNTTTSRVPPECQGSTGDPNKSSTTQLDTMETSAVSNEPCVNPAPPRTNPEDHSMTINRQRTISTPFPRGHLASARKPRCKRDHIAAHVLQRRRDYLSRRLQDEHVRRAVHTVRAMARSHETLRVARASHGRRDARRRALLRGLHYGQVPFGYDKSPEGHLVPNFDALVVRWVFELRAHKTSLAEIVERMNAAQFRHPRGMVWTMRMVSAMLGRRVYAGLSSDCGANFHGTSTTSTATVVPMDVWNLTKSRR